MHVFEFLMVLVSIVIGLGLAALLTGGANVLRVRRQVHVYWVHALLVVGFFLAQAQVWWESWGLMPASEWTFVGMLMMLASPVFLFLGSHLLFPQSADLADLEEYYYEIAPIIWLLGAGAVTVGTLFRPVVFGEPLLSVDNFSSLPTLVVCLAFEVTPKS